MTLGVLASFALEARSKKHAATMAKLAAAGVPVVWDSGAFSAFTGKARVDLDQHTEWVKANDHGNPLVRFVGLDVIGDPDATLDNYRRQRAAGANVEPTIHYGEPLDQVDRLLDAGVPDWFNVGGLVPYLRPQHHRNIAAFIAQVRRRLPDGVKLHALGCCTPRVMQLVHVDASDSTAWLNPDKFRILNLFCPRKGDWRRFEVARDKADRTAAWHEAFRAAPWFRQYYGVGPDVIATPPIDPLEVSKLAIRALGVLADWAAARHDSAVTVYLAGGIASPAMRSVLLDEQEPAA